MRNFNFVTLSANIPQCCFGINFAKRNIRFTVLMKRVLRFFVFVVFAEKFFRFGFWCLFQLFWTLSNCMCYGFTAVWHDQCV